VAQLGEALPYKP